ncbi:hypothetical protein E2C01_038988 [Portunus trituberculatus]|uniref:Uncharacterized protein n=1 Tax=Portunus trituberculatus TaxID=210409 RepID=A0A5B7FJH5_PORTR|nr:hypothetical protein [Portunus trituberculatus]
MRTRGCEAYRGKGERLERLTIEGNILPDKYRTQFFFLLENELLILFTSSVYSNHTALNTRDDRQTGRHTTLAAASDPLLHSARLHQNLTSTHEFPVGFSYTAPHRIFTTQHSPETRQSSR